MESSFTSSLVAPDVTATPHTLSRTPKRTHAVRALAPSPRQTAPRSTRFTFCALIQGTHDRFPIMCVTRAVQRNVARHSLVSLLKELVMAKKAKKKAKKKASKKKAAKKA
jgi:hypothetical protein